MSRKITIEQVKAFVASKNWKCLSDVYVNSITKMEFECAKGHRWMTCFHYVKNGQNWCLTCAGRSKNLCRDLLTSYTKLEFPSMRPKFLKGLELDGYNKEWKIAFEYQGEQML